LKQYFTIIASLLFASSLKAQTGYNYYGYGVGFGASASYVRAYTSIPVEYSHFAFSLNLTYNYSPYIPIEAEIQIGTFSGGGLSPSVDSLGREYVDHYRALILHSDFQLGGLINYGGNRFLNIVKNVFLGTGIGLISNKDEVQRTSASNPSYVFPGEDHSVDVMIPIRLGYEFKIFDKDEEPSVAIDICYIRNFVFGNGINGYYDPSAKIRYAGLDNYRQFTISFKYYLGNIVSYKKLIRPIK
jgi:hypothetical protein